MRTKPIPELTENQIRRFWSKVDKGPHPKGCWLWTPVKTNKYGRFYIKRYPYLAHRCSYTIVYGTIPNDLCVLHRCDVPRCCNPEHLFLGTVLDNNLDMKQKGRHARGRRSPEQLINMRRGSDRPNSKLTYSESIEIRIQVASGLKQTEVAKNHKVSRSLVSMIVNDTRWVFSPNLTDFDNALSLMYGDEAVESEYYNEGVMEEMAV